MQKQDNLSSNKASSSSLILFISWKFNIYIRSCETRARLIDLRTRSLRLDPYLSFSLSHSLECIHSHPLIPLSYSLTASQSFTVAFLSRSRIMNLRFVSVSVSTATSPLSTIPTRTRRERVESRKYGYYAPCIWCTRFCNEQAQAVNVYRESIVWLAISARVPTLRGDDCFIRCMRLTDRTGYVPSDLMSTE